MLSSGVYDVPADGDCQFHAIALGMLLLRRQHAGGCPAASATSAAGKELWGVLAATEQEGVPDGFALALRRAVVAQIYASYDKEVCVLEGFGDGDREAWEVGGPASRTWGNDVTLSAAAVLLGLRIHVLKVAVDSWSGKATDVTFGNVKNEPGANGTLHILARGDQHYQYLCATERGTALCCPDCLPSKSPEMWVVCCGKCGQRVAPR